MSELENAAYLEIVKNNGEVFENSSIDDIIFFCPKNQKFLISPYTESNASLLTLSTDWLSVHGTLDVKNNAQIQSNLEAKSSTFKDTHIKSTLLANNITACNLTLNRLDLQDTLNISHDIFAQNAYFSNIILQDGDIQTNAQIFGQNLDISSNVKTNNLNAQTAQVENIESTMMKTQDIQTHHLDAQKMHIHKNMHLSSFIGFSRRKD